MGDSAKPWSGNVLIVACERSGAERRFPLDAEDLPRYAPNETLRAAEAAPALFASLCGECPKPCDGSLALVSVKNRQYYVLADMPKAWALRTAWSLLAVTPIEAKRGGEGADDGDRHD